MLDTDRPSLPDARCTCPCGARRLVRILYGLPTERGFQMIDAALYYFAGEQYWEGLPAWWCEACKAPVDADAEPAAEEIAAYDAQVAAWESAHPEPNELV